jgi:hypothetical protein
MSVARSVLPRSAPMLRADNPFISVTFLMSSPLPGGLAFIRQRSIVVCFLEFSVPWTRAWRHLLPDPGPDPALALVGP